MKYSSMMKRNSTDSNQTLNENAGLLGEIAEASSVLLEEGKTRVKTTSANHDEMALAAESSFHLQERAESPLNSIASAASSLTSLEEESSTPHGVMKNPIMNATMQSINGFLQQALGHPQNGAVPYGHGQGQAHVSHPHPYPQAYLPAQGHPPAYPHPSHSFIPLPHKVRLSGPIRAHVNVRHGVWAPRLRCRKRKNLFAKADVFIHPTCTIEQLLPLVSSVLPDEFEWNSEESPLRYQAVNDQSLQSLKPITFASLGGQSLYTAFDLVRNRRSDGDNFILQLYVYGTWTLLHKYPHYQQHLLQAAYSNARKRGSREESDEHDDDDLDDEQEEGEEDARSSSSVEPVSFKKFLPTNPRPPTSAPTSTSTPISTSISMPNAPVPLSAAPTVPNFAHVSAIAAPSATSTVILEMRLNGVFVPIEITRRSFLTALRSSSLLLRSPTPPPTSPEPHEEETSEEEKQEKEQDTEREKIGKPDGNGKPEIRTM